MVSRFIGIANAQTATPTATSTPTATATLTPTFSPTATPTPVSQTGYKPRADYYAYNWYTFATLPVSPFGSIGTELRCLDCTPTYPTGQDSTTHNPPLKCVYGGYGWDCSGGKGGVIAGGCVNLGTVTTNTFLSYATTSCNVITTATNGLTYVFEQEGLQQDQELELDSYISGSITGPFFGVDQGGTIKWINGSPPVSSGTSGYVDILFLKWNGTNLIETGEAIGVH
jgi:hypothetical protein